MLDWYSEHEKYAFFIHGKKIKTKHAS